MPVLKKNCKTTRIVEQEKNSKKVKAESKVKKAHEEIKQTRINSASKMFASATFFLWKPSGSFIVAFIRCILQMAYSYVRINVTNNKHAQEANLLNNHSKNLKTDIPVEV